MLIVVMVLVLIVVAVLLAMLILKSSKSSEEENETNIKESILKLFENNYLYYYYMYGDIEVDSTYIVQDDVEYYLVIDEQINSLESISNLVKETFISESHVNLMNKENTNEYITLNDQIYVHKTSDACQNIVEFNFNNLRYSIDNDKMTIIFYMNGAYAYLDDGTWKLGNDIYYCLD